MLLFSDVFTISVILTALGCTKAQYSATYLPSNAPAKTEQGQTGTNQCGTGSSQSSECQNAFINSVTDFCLFAPPNPGPDSTIGNTERIEVAWCIKSGTGARLIPEGAIKGAHFVQTPDFVQVTGIGDLTLINIPAGDEGGELDPHGADGNGNPIGGLVFSTAFGQLEQLHEWTNFMSDSEFCFRACKPGPKAPTFCQHIYDVMGCQWNMPANYGPGFESCEADSGEPMGVYGTSTFFQGQPVTPAAHPIPSSSRCISLNTIGNGVVLPSTTILGPTTGASSTTSSAVSTQSTQNTQSAQSTSPRISAPISSGSSQISTTASVTSSPPTPTLSVDTGSANSPTTTSSASGITSNTPSSAATRISYNKGLESTVMALGVAVASTMLGSIFLF